MGRTRNNTAQGRTVVRYWVQGLAYTIDPDGAVIDHVLDNPGINVQQYLDQLLAAGDPRVTLAPLLQPNPGSD